MVPIVVSGMIAQISDTHMMKLEQRYVLSISLSLVLHFILTIYGVQFFTCGSRKVAEGVKQVLMSIICEARGVSEEEGALLFDRAILERYSTDVFE